MCLVHGAVLFAGALGDLDQAIALSGSTGHTACQALVQRGLLHRLARQNDEARADFEKAAALGSEFARQQAVVLNPYAALCNKMLSEVINKLRNPETSDMQWCKTLGVRLLWKSEINKLTFLWCSLNSVHCAAKKSRIQLKITFIHICRSHLFQTELFSSQSKHCCILLNMTHAACDVISSIKMPNHTIWYRWDTSVFIH